MEVKGYKCPADTCHSYNGISKFVINGVLQRCQEKGLDIVQVILQPLKIYIGTLTQAERERQKEAAGLLNPKLTISGLT